MSVTPPRGLVWQVVLYGGHVVNVIAEDPDDACSKALDRTKHRGIKHVRRIRWRRRFRPLP